MATHTNLKRALSNSVPYRMREVYDRGGPTPAEMNRAADYVIRFGEEKRMVDLRSTGDAALFNGLAEALAVLAWKEGGVTLFGETWDIKRTHLPPGD